MIASVLAVDTRIVYLITLVIAVMNFVKKPS